MTRRAAENGTSSAFQEIDEQLRALEGEGRGLRRKGEALDEADSAFAAIERTEFLVGECEQLHERLHVLFQDYRRYRREHRAQRDGERLDSALRDQEHRDVDWVDFRTL